MARPTRTTGELIWRGAELTRQLDKVMDGTLDAAALKVARSARDIQQAENIVDTHFSKEGYYHVGPVMETYSSTAPPGLYRSTKTGRLVRRGKVGRAPRPAGTAIVANVATYHLKLELRYGILRRALDRLDEPGIQGIMRVQAVRARL